ncbi:MAG TPA: T9SS type A sorting domain-containing protein, partial [Candidatus Marinimicrobia bacterium]|nr:T9SS type A sorting domain-containing protein [Candidatus Neomarinimicrobiota bacterium]
SFTLTVTPVNDLPSEFNLYSPANEALVIINDNTYSDSLIFFWSESQDADGDTLFYSWVGTGGLEQLDIVDMIGNEFTIAYATIYDMIDQSHLDHWSEASEITGTWTVVAKDKESNVQAVNGPFNLTIRENVLALDGRELLPDIFALHENYPNPFNPVTNITYDLPERSKVRLTVFDITGRRIRQIVNGYQEAGFQSAVWEGTDDTGRPVSGGLYFYQLQAGEFVKTRKMLLIK